MRFPRLALPAALAATALALSTFATPAFADDDPAASTIYPVSGDVVFVTQTSGSVTLDYLCPADDAGVPRTTTLVGSVYQDVGDDLREQADGAAEATCDGVRHSAVVTLELVTGDEIFPRAAKLRATLDATEVLQDVVVVREEAPEPSPTPTPIPTPTPTPTPDPTPTQPPAPVKATVALTTNASPESVVKGKKITVKGTVKKNGKKFKAKTQLQFAPDSTRTYKKVKSVTSSKSGKLSTTLKATTSGAFRYVYAGSSKTKAATSAGDHIDVKAKPKPAPKPTPKPSKPKPKAYKNCTALNKVYPHGVGKSGAHDKKKSGSPVTNFTRDNKTYAKNTKSDRDKDGIACER